MPGKNLSKASGEVLPSTLAGPCPAQRPSGCQPLSRLSPRAGAVIVKSQYPTSVQDKDTYTSEFGGCNGRK